MINSDHAFVIHHFVDLGSCLLLRAIESQSHSKERFNMV